AASENQPEREADRPALRQRSEAHAPQRRVATAESFTTRRSATRPAPDPGDGILPAGVGVLALLGLHPRLEDLVDRPHPLELLLRPEARAEAREKGGAGRGGLDDLRTVDGRAEDVG